MKITVNVDCTPLEARQFMGLPDVEPMQKAAMAEIEKRMMTELERFSPEVPVQGLASDRRHERRMVSGFLAPLVVLDPSAPRGWRSQGRNLAFSGPRRPSGGRAPLLHSGRSRAERQIHSIGPPVFASG